MSHSQYAVTMAGESDTTVYFLLVYNLKARHLESHQQFDDVDEAMAVYAETEIKYLGHGYEVVLVGAESIEAVMITHGSYFDPQPDAIPTAGLSFSLS